MEESESIVSISFHFGCNYIIIIINIIIVQFKSKVLVGLQSQGMRHIYTFYEFLWAACFIQTHTQTTYTWHVEQWKEEKNQ